ncbi:hypothetical protein CXU15_02625 [Akkermansia muciniphila]|uniref:Uncharacterized protein n=1 Tax=Akkermansia massiliensis TaxID=2927224 RepID=A0AAE6W1C7_9BACT|nr:hypothetical protein CXU18_02015 [Akkermansia muciniphila]PNC51982.1 hypothetical protein CXU15_02625 [Akkermansia muciniphila]QHV61962.1 hypothetical protein DMI76_00600 [Akkermansia massiliensis]QHV74329.1 hypothetical protein DMI75_00600 [Akkermansia massiliensis]
MASVCSSVNSFFAAAGAGAAGEEAIFLAGAFRAVFGSVFFSTAAAGATAFLAGLAAFSGSAAFFLQHFFLAGASCSTAVLQADFPQVFFLGAGASLATVLLSVFLGVGIGGVSMG